ncbi:helix-turn-helix domain-containing protein [Oceanirhabdus sp. W0125-5]|uniref:helix-turn-helix domain-containing protein n=1 Tax=Oceanirhabdus sp. W0125-5 TaxID=2999116 RepID=UPI002FDEC092
MKINKAYKFRMYPNENQIKIIEKSFGCSRYVYNHFLNQRNEIYRTTKSITKYEKRTCMA